MNSNSIENILAQISSSVNCSPIYSERFKLSLKSDWLVKCYNSMQKTNSNPLDAINRLAKTYFQNWEPFNELSFNENITLQLIEDLMQENSFCEQLIFNKTELNLHDYFEDDVIELLKKHYWESDTLLQKYYVELSFVPFINGEKMLHGKHDNLLDKLGFIYILQDRGIYKIGFTKDVKSRLTQHKTSNPSVILIESFNGLKSDESFLHKKYAHKNYAREWFNLNEDDIQDIKKYFLNQ